MFERSESELRYPNRCVKGEKQWKITQDSRSHWLGRTTMLMQDTISKHYWRCYERGLEGAAERKRASYSQDDIAHMHPSPRLARPAMLISATPSA
jgi:hypothetical protein